MLASLQLALSTPHLAMTIKAVFFDAAGTLIKPARSVGESYAAIAAKHGKEVSSTNITERFRTCFDAAPRLAFTLTSPSCLLISPNPMLGRFIPRCWKL